MRVSPAGPGTCVQKRSRCSPRIEVQKVPSGRTEDSTKTTTAGSRYRAVFLPQKGRSRAKRPSKCNLYRKAGSTGAAALPKTATSSRTRRGQSEHVPAGCNAGVSQNPGDSGAGNRKHPFCLRSGACMTCSAAGGCLDEKTGSAHGMPSTLSTAFRAHQECEELHGARQIEAPRRRYPRSQCAREGLRNAREPAAPVDNFDEY